MPFLYVYSPSDFVETPPAESGAMAAGSGTFTLELAPGATPTLIEVNDADGVLDEIDYSQTLDSGVNIDGTEYAEGTTIHSAYDLLNTDTGHKVTSLHFGGDGYEQGAIHGMVSTVRFEPGQTYTFNVERTSHRKNHQYEDYVACFAADTRIRTTKGDIRAIDLTAGDMIETQDAAAQVLRLKLVREIGAEELTARPNLRPICVTAGALGQGLPKRDLWVSPQHRMLVSGPLCERMFGRASVLIPARKMCSLPGVYEDASHASVTYVHLVFDSHQLVFAEGAPSESFSNGAKELAGMTEDARREFLELFPQAKTVHANADAVRPILEGAQARDLARRLGKNNQQALQHD